MYRETIPHAELAKRQHKTVNGTAAAPVALPGKESKVNRICKAFLDVLLPARLATNLQNIVTAYVCKSPPDHDAALLLIAKLRGEFYVHKDCCCISIRLMFPVEKDMELAEQAIIHVCFLADANRLYNTALGLYDLELTLMVAQQSQKVKSTPGYRALYWEIQTLIGGFFVKDPREYLPYLQKLEEMDATRRKFAIDNDLRRYAKALGHLVELGDKVLEEVKNYVVSHELYQQALGLFRYKAEVQKVCPQACGYWRCDMC